MNRTCRLFGVLLAGASMAQAADYYAAQNGQTPEAPHTSWATAASNIQDAVNAATLNATVWVGAGRYTVPTNAVVYEGTNVVYIGQALTLRGSNGVPGDVVIDGEGAYRGMAVVYKTASTTNRFVIDGLTVSNGMATNYGGGIYFATGTRSWRGEVRNCRLTGNVATNGASIAMFADSSVSTVLLVSNCVVANNQALNGAGPYCYRVGLALLDNVVSESNRAAAFGGGLYFYTVGAATVSTARVRYNQATNGAAGVYAFSTKLDVEASAFHDNLVTATNRPTNQTGGGGLRLDTCVTTLRNTLLYNNYSEKEGGAIRTQNNNPKLYLYNCTVVSNSGLSYGAISMSALSGMELRAWNSIVYHNADRDLALPAGSYTNALYASFTNCCVTNEVAG